MWYFFLFSNIMSSILIAFYFITSVSGSKKYITGSAVYRANDNEFQELIYKGFVRTEENLISAFTMYYIAWFEKKSFFFMRMKHL